MNSNTKRKTGVPVNDLSHGERTVNVGAIPPETRFLTNITFLLGDVIDSMLIEVCYRVNRCNCDLKHTSKMRWKNAITQLRAAQRAFKAFSAEIYQLENTEQACDDSDYVRNLLVLIADRVGDDEEAQLKLKLMIENMPSRCGFYDELKSE